MTLGTWRDMGADVPCVPMTTTMCIASEGCSQAPSHFFGLAYGPQAYWLTDTVLLAIAVVLLLAAIFVVFRRNLRYQSRWLLLIALVSFTDLVGIGYEVDREVRRMQDFQPCSGLTCPGADSQGFVYKEDER